MPEQQKHQYSLSLIQHQVNDSVIAQRGSDGYINATELCNAAGKRWYNYRRIEPTGKFLRALEAKTHIGVTELIQEVKTVGEPATWVHPLIAINLAQWLSANVAVQVSQWVYDWMEGRGSPSQAAKLPSHLARYVANDGAVPVGFFSVLQETGLGLFAPLHNVGFDIPKGWVPDISVGKLFCAWLRKEKGYDTDSLPTYNHDYQDGRIVPAKLYPDDLLAVYRRWFRTKWLPEHGVRYFKAKDPSCMQYIDKIPALAAPSRVPIIAARA